MENIQNILEQTGTKTAKIKMLLRLGMPRKQVAEAMGVGYGFVQNVYASVYGVARPRKFRSDAFSFDRTFGVEMEIIHESESKIRSAIRNAGVECEIEGYNHDTRTHWKIVSDASVDGGFEVVSPVLKGRGGLDELEKVCNALVNAGARIRKCCGLHVHLGTDDFKTDIRVWKNLYKNYAALERTIDSFMPPSRRHNQYCRSMRVCDWNAKIESAANLRMLEDAVTGGSRYFKLNSQSYWRHKTVEFRQHSGSVEFEKVRNWILFCARFVEFSRRNTVETGRKSETSTMPFWQARSIARIAKRQWFTPIQKRRGQKFTGTTFVPTRQNADGKTARIRL